MSESDSIASEETPANAVTWSAGGFNIIATVLDVRVGLPIVIADNLTIDRPTDEQLETIYQLFAASPWGQDLRTVFECLTVESIVPGGASYEFTPLDRAQWRYLVLNYSGNGIDAASFFNAANLVEPRLHSVGISRTSGLLGRGDKRSWGFDDMAVHRQFLSPYRLPDAANPPSLDQAAVDRIRGAYMDLKNLDPIAHRGICRAVELLSLFGRLPLGNFLDVLALFMVIEMLLTHDPSGKEIGDSLNHQIREKVPFVMDQMGEQLDYSCFASTDAKKIWSALYSYRSDIAHGGEADFQKELRILKDSATADRFLTGATRRLLRHAVQQPRLFEGLKSI